MKKILVLLAIFGVLSLSVYAEDQFQSNGTNVGIAAKVNIKGCTTTRSGQIVTIDCTAVAGPQTITGALTVTGLTTVRGGINWQSVNASSQGINWSEIPKVVTNQAINWNDILNVQATSAGVNWNYLETTSGGINWVKVSNNAASTNIVCWNTRGQLGRCGTSVSGVNCTACN